MTLQGTYQKLKDALGDQIEPFEAIELVDAYRQYLKPASCNVILLAESHVYTTKADISIPLSNIPELPGYPRRYAKFVYCLGYGERSLTNSVHHPKRDGTPQFWKIFASCGNVGKLEDSFTAVQSKTSAVHRIRNKVNLLLRLKANGIWLIDTSIAALYREGKKLKNMNEALAISWTNHTRQIVYDENPAHVICIGKGVAAVVEKDLARMFPDRYSVVAQPNAFLSSEEHMENFRHYNTVCGGKPDSPE